MRAQKYEIFTSSEPYIVIHIREKDQQGTNFFI